MSSNLVSVIVPCYNHAKHLTETLDSVQAQTYVNWECVIVNDGSSDNTEEISLKYSKADKRFKYLYQPNQGVVAARNNGVHHSSGIYILPLDGDDKIAPTYLEKAVTVLDKDEHVKLVYCLAKLFDVRTGMFELKEYSFRNLLVRNMIFATAFYRRKDFNSVGGYDPVMDKGLEDWEFWISLLQDGGEVVQIPEVLFFYRIVEGSRNRVLDKGIEQALRKKIYLKHQLLYDQTFGDPIEVLREKDRLSNRMHAIYKSKVYKILSLPNRFRKR